jgi:hypothetical protein
MLTPMIVCIVVGMGTGPEIEPPHAENPLYSSLRRSGVMIEGHEVKFPAPLLHDGQSAAAEGAALRKLAGSEGAVAELTRDSVSAPFVLKVRDEPAGAATTIRLGDLWFVVRADLDAIDPARVTRQAAEGKPVEAGNMRFESHVLTADELASASGRARPPQENQRRHEWFVHVTGRLLDRIHFEATDHVVATRSDSSWVVASRTDPAFDDDKTFPNRWWPVVRRKGREEAGTARRYAGGAGYLKLSRLSTVPGALLVEAHFAFAEPRAWFDGAPILRSKIGLMAQDRIRQLRRDLTQARESGSSRGQGNP